MRLTEQKNGKWNEEDRLELARLLIKGGYRVAIRKERREGKSATRVYVEVGGDTSGEGDGA